MPKGPRFFQLGLISEPGSPLLACGLRRDCKGRDEYVYSQVSSMSVCKYLRGKVSKIL